MCAQVRSIFAEHGIVVGSLHLDGLSCDPGAERLVGLDLLRRRAWTKRRLLSGRSMRRTESDDDRAGQTGKKAAHGESLRLFALELMTHLTSKPIAAPAAINHAGLIRRRSSAITL